MQACLFLPAKSQTGSVRQQKKMKRASCFGGAAAVCVTFCSHANTANYLTWCRTIGFEMPTMTQYCRFGLKRSPEVVTETKLLFCLFTIYRVRKVFSRLGRESDNTTRVILIRDRMLLLWHHLLSSQSRTSSLVVGETGVLITRCGSRSAVCDANSLLLGKQDKKDGGPDRNMGRPSFTKNWREECDQIRCSSPGPCCHWAPGSILIGQDTS